VVALRHIGPYHEIGSTFGRLLGTCASLGIPNNLTVAIYHDDPSAVPPQELRSDACLVVGSAPSLPEGSELRIMTMEGGEFATATHIGSYAGLGDAWSQFMGMAVPALGRATGSLCFEVYYDDCSVTPADQLRTDLFMQLA
jgi:AraC family transcriptional regulator